MPFRHLNWAAIGFGAGAGLFSSLVLFVILFGLGENAAVQIGIVAIGYFIAGVVAGRFSLADARLSGGIAAMGLFFVMSLVTVTGGSVPIVWLLVFGTAAAIIGPIGGTIGYGRRDS